MIFVCIFQQALNLETKKPSISLTVPGAIGSPSSSSALATSKPSEALTKPGESYTLTS
jgi:hypothetical protein